jgi:hypothetical protein
MIKWLKNIIMLLGTILMLINSQQISYSSGFGCLITKYDPDIKSNLKCFGDNLYEIPNNSNFTQISCSNLRCCGILTNNTISCLGHGYNINDTNKILDKPNDLSTQVLVMNELSCALTLNKKLRCWRLPANVTDQYTNITHSVNYYNDMNLEYDRLFKATSTNYNFFSKSDNINKLNSYALYLWDNSTYTELYNNEIYSHKYGIILWDKLAFQELNKKQGLFSNYSDICNGDKHACGIKSIDSKIECWGDDTYGQLQIPEPYQEYAAITCGYKSTCAIASLDSRVICWGDDTNGQLSIPYNLKAIQIDSDMEKSTCGVLLSKKPFCVGEYLNLPHEPITKIGLGDYMTCGYINTTNILKCIGSISYEHKLNYLLNDIQCNKGICCWIIQKTLNIECSGPNSNGYNYILPNNYKFKQIALGLEHICGLTYNQTIICNDGGRNLGRINPPNYTYMFIAAYNYFTCGLTIINNMLICWGDYPYSINVNIIQSMSGYNYKQIATGENFICGIVSNINNFFEDDTVRCSVDTTHPFNVIPPYREKFESIKCSKNSCCGLFLYKITCWGRYIYTSPATIKFIDYDLGIKHACGITTDYKIHCWGDNLFGQSIHDEFNNEVEQLSVPSTYKIGSIINYCNNSYSFSYGSITPICSGYCQSGTYSNLSIRSAYNTPYNTKCNYNCPKGYYCPFKSYLPIKCAAGLYNNMLNQDSCYLYCPVGSYCPEGTDTPINCPVGRYSDQIGSTSCNNCPLGKISSKGESYCTSCITGYTSSDQSICLLNTCSAGRYSEIINNISFTDNCLECPIKTTSKAGASSCSLCEIDSYSYQTGTSYPCPTCTNVFGVKCKRDNILINSGIYAWINNDTGLDSMKCQPHMCIGGTIENMCHPTREGILCGKCKDGYTLQGSKCVSCDKPNIGLIFLVIFAIICYNNFIHFISQLPEKRAGVKILIYYIQVVSMTTYPLSDYLSWISFIDFNPKNTGSLCLFPMSSFQTITLNTCMPLIFIGFYFLQMILHQFLSNKLNNKIEYDLKRYLKTMENMFLFLINTLIITSVQYISCINVPSFGSFNYRNPSINCNSSEYITFYPLFMFILVNGFVTIPLWSILSQIKYDKQIAIYKIDKQIYKYIHLFYYPFSLLRRLIIALVSNIIFNDRDKYLSLSICNLTFLICHIICMPYTENIDNYAELLSLLILTVLSISLTHTPPPFDDIQDQLIFFFLILIPTIILLANVLYWLEYRKIYNTIKITISNIINKCLNCKCNNELKDSCESNIIDVSNNKIISIEMIELNLNSPNKS